MEKKSKVISRPNTYTCNEYREEMMLAGLRKRISRSDLSEQERSDLEKEILRLEKAMDF